MDRAAEGWRERQTASLSAADAWQLETFQQLFNEVRNSKSEDLSDVPDPVANGGNQLPLSKPESWKLAARFYNNAVWQRLHLGSAPLAGGWPDAPAPPEVPVPVVTAGARPSVTPHPSDNPALFAAVENCTRAASKHALENVRSRTGDFRTALILTMLLLQAVSWITITVTATRDIGGN